MREPTFIPLPNYKRLGEHEMIHQARSFRTRVETRRTVRFFSEDPVPIEIIMECIRAAGTAPSGANMQPWHFVVVTNGSVKTKIRIAAEEEEKEFYEHRAPKQWLDALAPLGTDADKPFLETAPYLIAIFAERYAIAPDGSQIKQYYTTESVGIATGILITALHHAGLATLTHTPSPMNFLNDILGRPQNEKPFLLLVVGYPASGCVVPDIHRKQISDIMTVL
jgi:nitroreductase